MREETGKRPTLDVDLRDVADMTGDGRMRCLNPKHHDHSPSMYVYDDHLHCYACGYHLAGMAALMALTATTTEQAAREKAKTYPMRPHSRRPAKPPTRLAPALARMYHQNLCLLPDRRGWLHARGLADWVIDEQQLGYATNAWTIPVWDNDRTELLNVRFRLDPAYTLPDDLDRRKYSGLAGNNRALPYGFWWLERDSEWVVICEGELDALRLHQEGLPAAAISNGAGVLEKLVEPLLAHLPRLRAVVICRDQDERGAEAAQKLSRVAAGHGLATMALEWNAAIWGKDISEFLCRGGSAQMFMTARDATLTLAL